MTRLYERIPIKEADKLTSEYYTPGGRTALHDAIATAITETDDQLQVALDSSTPEVVGVVVLTDGKENASQTPQDRVRELVEEYQDEHGWEFLFIGANHDAALTAERMGMDRDRSLDMSHSGEGASAAQESISENISHARRTGGTRAFDEEDRRRQRDADGS